MRSFVFALVFLACSLTLAAQSTPKIEIFGGFSYLNYEVLSTHRYNGTETVTCPTSSGTECLATSVPTEAVDFNPRMGLYGWNGSVTAYLTSRFGITADFSGNYGKATDSITTKTTVTTTYVAPCAPNCTTTEIDTDQFKVSDPTLYTFLFGPQFTFPVGKVKAYGHFLTGGEHTSLSVSDFYNYNLGSENSPFPITSTSAKISGNHYAMAFGGGADYPIRKKLSLRVGADYLTSTGKAQNHVLVLTGIVWRPWK